jgi:DNA-binding MarR family transcriptional regulator
MERDELLDYIERIGNLLRAEQRAAGSAHGLQAVHVAALKYLEHCNRYSDTPAALTAFLGSTKGTVSQTLKVLERGGYVRRSDDRVDGRVVRLELTQKGRRLLKLVRQSADWRGAVDGMKSAEYEVTSHALQALLRRTQQSNGYRTFGQCATCRHFLDEGGNRYRCGLTREGLGREDTTKICFEHEPPVEA